MHYSTLLLALAASTPLVAAHGKIAVATGDAGGNTTALGILGGIVPGPGKNSVTETDTTVFKSVNPATDGLGKTKAGGANTLAGIKAVMDQSGTTLAQVSDGGSVSGTYHIVTTDGAGPLTAIVDPTGTGAFASGVQAEMVTDVPGRRGNIAAPKQRRWWARALISAGLMKRAANVNEDYPFKVAIPAGTTCSGTMGGQTNVCLLKIANPSRAGPFGGVMAFQMAGTGGNATSASTSTEAADASSADDSESVQTEPDTKRAVKFSA